MTILDTYSFGELQASDKVLGKFMFTDCADKDAFYRLRVSNPISLYDGNTIYDSNNIFFDNDTRGNVNISGPGSESCMTLTVNTGAIQEDYAARQTHYYAHYQPGKSLLSLFSFCMGSSVNGIIKRVGLYDVDNSNFNNPLNGVLLEQTSSGLYWKVYKGDGTFQSAEQSNWNVDSLDGNGPSGITINPVNNLLGFIDLEWLGVGRVRVGFFINGVPVICNTFNNSQFNVPYLNNPYLPVRYEIRKTQNISTSGMFKAICCTVSSEGGYEPIGVSHSFKTPTLSVNVNNIESLLSLRINSSNSRSSIIPISLEMTSNIGGNSIAYYSIYLWRPSSYSAVTEIGWNNVSGSTGGFGSISEYNTSTTMYTDMVNDVNNNSAICIKINESTISSVSKSKLDYITKSLCNSQSNVNKLNTDIIVIVINNTTSNSRNFTALFTWKEL